MAESIFSIFPDGQLTSGHGAKGNVPRSKKKALCDVKNTLQSKRTGMIEPLRKLNFDQGEGSCKQSIKETPAKVTSKQEGTFTIATDEDYDVYWDKCKDCDRIEHDLFDFRPERLTNDDVDYLARGFMSLPSKEPVHLPVDDKLLFEVSVGNDDWFEIEVDSFPVYPVDDFIPELLSDDD